MKLSTTKSFLDISPPLQLAILLTKVVLAIGTRRVMEFLWFSDLLDRDRLNFFSQLHSKADVETRAGLEAVVKCICPALLLASRFGWDSR